MVIGGGEGDDEVGDGWSDDGGGDDDKWEGDMKQLFYCTLNHYFEKVMMLLMMTKVKFGDTDADDGGDQARVGEKDAFVCCWEYFRIWWAVLWAAP